MQKLFICFSIVLLLSFSILLPISYSYTDYSFIWSDDSIISTSTNIIENTNNTYNINNINNNIINTTNSISTNSSPELSLESESAILIEQNSGKILYEHNCHEQLRPASVTKVMSILLIMEAIDNGTISLNDKVPCSQNAANMGGSQIWLDPREELTVNEMLKAMCVASANDCTVAMAEYLAGSEESFVEKMNARAKELGMNDTCFKNCHGLDTDGHVTSSYDISLMSRELLKNHPSITNYTTIWTDTLRDGKSELTNTNKLIRNYKGATGLKTGSTGLALYNLSASATRDNLSLIAVIMKAPSTKVRFEEAKKLLDYGFTNYSYCEFAKKDSILTTLPVTKGVSNTVDIIYSDNSGCILSKGEDKNIEQVINLPDSIQAPINAGQKIGEVNYMLNGETLGSTSLVSNKSIKKINLSNMMESIFFKWFRILR